MALKTKFPNFENFIKMLWNHPLRMSKNRQKVKKISENHQKTEKMH